MLTQYAYDDALGTVAAENDYASSFSLPTAVLVVLSPAFSRVMAWLGGAQVWDSVRMNNFAQHFATAWSGSKLSTSEEERAHFQKFLATSFASRDSERESAEQWLGFDATEGRHPGLTLRKRAA